MSACIISKFNYRGHVKIYKELKQKKVLVSQHNEGTLALAQLFANAMSGHNTETLLPTYLDLYTNDNRSCLLDSIEINSDCKSIVYESATYKRDESGYHLLYPEGWRVYFDVKVPKKAITSSVTAVTKIVMLSADKQILAQVTFEEDSSEIKSIFEGNNNLVINWEMELRDDIEGVYA